MPLPLFTLHFYPPLLLHHQCKCQHSKKDKQKHSIWQYSFDLAGILKMSQGPQGSMNHTLRSAILDLKSGSDKKQLVGDKGKFSSPCYTSFPGHVNSWVAGGRSTFSCNVHYLVLSIESLLISSQDHAHVCSSNAIP